jgi:hypothetical protein
VESDSAAFLMSEGLTLETTLQQLDECLKIVEIPEKWIEIVHHQLSIRKRIIS